MSKYKILDSDTPYNNSVDKFNSIVFFGATLLNAIANYFINFYWTTYEILMQVLFGWVRSVLIAGFLISLLSVAVADNHQSIIENANYLKCANVGFFNTAEAFTGIVAERTPPIICFSNFFVSFSSIATKSVLVYLWDCSDFSNVFDDLKTLLAKTVESFVLFWFKEGTSPLSNRYDIASIVKSAQDLIGNLKQPLICACNDFSAYSLYILSVIQNENIPVASDNFGNSGIALVQTVVNTVLNVFTLDRDQVPSIEFINQVCEGTLATGAVVDDAFTNFVQIFWTSFDPSKIGSVLAGVVCLFTDILYLFWDSNLNYIWVAAFDAEAYNIFKDADLDPIIRHLDELGVNLVYTITPLNICLAQSVGNFFRLLSSIIAYSRDIVQKGENNLGPVRNSLSRWVGQSSYGGGGHILNSAGHSIIRPQTSLTCLLSTATNFNGVYSTCSVKLGDLANSIVNLILTPLELISEILDNTSLLSSIDGNPLRSETRDDFEQFFEIIFDVVLDELFNPFDYTAHLVGCIPLLNPFSVALQTVVRNLRNIARDLRSLIIKIIEFLVELVILVLTVLSGPVFDNSSNAIEFGIFGQILLDLFKQLLTLVLEFAKNIISLTIGAPFPALFNQPTMYADSHTDSSSPATLPACFGDFGECICGIFYVNIGKNMCIPFTDICLADILPSCGIFQTTPTWSSTERKRSTGVSPYETYFEYLANEFPNGNCGEVFRTFENYGKDENGKLRYSSVSENSTLFYEKSVPSLQATAFLTCLDRLFKSFELAEASNWTIPSDYYIQDTRFLDSSSEIMRGSGMLFFDTIMQSVDIFSFPEYAAGLPTADKPKLDTVYTHESSYNDGKKYFQKNGVEDPMALDYLANINSLVSATIAKSKNFFMEKSRSMNQKNRNPYLRIAEIGGELISTSIATSFLIGREVLGTDVLPHLVDGTINTLQTFETTSLKDIFPPVQQTQHLRKRDHSQKLGGKWFPVNKDNLDFSEVEALPVEDYEIAFQKNRQLMLGTAAVGRKIFGPYLELLERRDMKEERLSQLNAMKIGNPKRDRTRFPHAADEDIISDDGFYHYSDFKKRNIMPHIYALNMSLPDSMRGDEVLNFHPDISYLYGMGGMIDFQHHIPNSCVRVRAYCDDNDANGCDEDMYFQTLGLCSSLFSYGIVSQCGEDFQAIAIYATDSCDGNPLVMAVATALNPVACVQFTIFPAGPINNFFCVNYTECQACPIERLIPNLDCAIIDRIAHYDKWLVQRCWVLFIGPILPPFNFTNTLPTIIDPLVVDPTGAYEPRPTPTPSATSTCTSVCGDRILSNELDTDGRPCEECDDGNTRDGDGCSSRCKREICPQWRSSSVYPIPPGQEVPASCGSGDFEIIRSGRTSRYCNNRRIVPFPYNGKLSSGDINLNSFQISCTSRTPVITEYGVPDCEGFSVSRTVRKNCSQEGTLDLAYYNFANPNGDVLSVAEGVRLGVDINCRFRCKICGDGAKNTPLEQCDSNPFSSSTCVYCLNTVSCDTDSQVCLGVCRPNFGEIPVDARYGVQAPSMCANFAGSGSVSCAIGSTCYYYTAITVVKRDVIPSNNSYYMEVFEFQAKLAQEEAYARLETQRVARSVQPPISLTRTPARQPRQPLFELQVSPVKNNFMYLKSKEIANDVVSLFYSETADSKISTIVDWWNRPGIGPNSDPDEQGAAYEALFYFICDPIKSFDGSLGYGIIKGTEYWLLFVVVLVVVTSFMGILASSTGITILMFTGFAVWLRLTFGLALIGCYITASQYYFRIPEPTFVYLHDIAVLLNGTCIDFLQPLARSPCDRNTCNQTFASCQDLNFIDGFDTLVAFVEVWMPDEVRIWLRTSETAGEFENALKKLSSASGYELYDSYTVAKQNFNFNGVVPDIGYRECTIITGLSFAQIALILLLSLYVVYKSWKVLYPLILDLGLVFYAFVGMINHVVIVPITAGQRDEQLLARLEKSKAKTKRVEIKVQ